MELGDKETVAICMQARVTCYLHVIHRYTRMVRRGVPRIFERGFPSVLDPPLTNFR